MQWLLEPETELRALHAGDGHDPVALRNRQFTSVFSASVTVFQNRVRNGRGRSPGANLGKHGEVIQGQVVAVTDMEPDRTGTG